MASEVDSSRASLGDGLGYRRRAGGASVASFFGRGEASRVPPRFVIGVGLAGEAVSPGEAAAVAVAVAAAGDVGIGDAVPVLAGGAVAVGSPACA